MNNAPKLFSLLESAGHTPQTGYILSGLHPTQLPSLATHNYLTTTFAWQLARYLNQKGGNINLQRTLELCLIHDLGKLMGGELNLFYTEKNPSVKIQAEALKQENFKYLSQHFAKDETYVTTLGEDFEAQKTDEAVLTKIACLIESLTYRLQHHPLPNEQLHEVLNTILALITPMTNQQNAFLLTKTLKLWEENPNFSPPF